MEAATGRLRGVGLGPKGSCRAFGGSAVPAPEPVHGRRSLVRHHGDELFDGIPSPFRAVRYHSLTVGDVPADLEVIATTQDGLIMAVRHRNRPLSGGQFHPEPTSTPPRRPLLPYLVATANAAPPPSSPTAP